jgi:hypothetical protein
MAGVFARREMADINGNARNVTARWAFPDLDDLIEFVDAVDGM